MDRRESTDSLSPVQAKEFGHRRRGAVRRGHIYEESILSYLVHL